MSGLRSLLGAPAPVVGIEIAAHRVAVVRMVPGSNPPAVGSATVEPLPPGAVVPALNEPNILDRGTVLDAVRRALDRTSARRKRAVLVIPDTSAKLSLLRFEKLPARHSDLEELIRWQVKKSVPFAIEDAQLTFAPTSTSGDGGREVVVVLARRDIIAEYESVCDDAGVQIGVVDLATLNLINTVVVAGAAPDGDWLLIHAAGDYLSVAILRGPDLLFFRHRGAEGDDTLADVVHQTAMYYEDRLQGRGFTRALLGGAGAAGAAGEAGAAVRQQLEQRLRVRVDVIDPRPAVVLADRIAVDPAFLDTLAPALGLLLRERVV